MHGAWEQLPDIHGKSLLNWQTRRVTELRSSWLFIPLAGFALATVGYLWGRNSSDPTAREARATPEAQATAGESRQVAALRHQVRTLRAANASLALHAQTAAEAEAGLERCTSCETSHNHRGSDRRVSVDLNA